MCPNRVTLTPWPGGVQRFDRIAGLINNAAMFELPAMSRLPLEKIPVEEWDRLMAVNLTGVFLG